MRPCCPWITDARRRACSPSWKACRRRPAAGSISPPRWSPRGKSSRAWSASPRRSAGSSRRRRPPPRSRPSTAGSCGSRASSSPSRIRAVIGSCTTSRCRCCPSPGSSAPASSPRSTPTATRSSSRGRRSCASATARFTRSTPRPRWPTSCCTRDSPNPEAAVYRQRSRRMRTLAAALVPAAEAQKRGGTLTIVRPTDPVSLDPNLETTAPGAWVYFNLLEGLLTLDETMQIKPVLATSYEVLSPTKVRFKLRPGVKFHDGTPFNAAAVKFTFDRALRGTPPARWASLAGSLAGAEVVDDLTVDIVTREPYGPILRTLAMYCMGIVSPTAVQKMGADFSRAPVGTGPFKFVEWKTNTHVIIERNPDYWGDKALVDRVVFKVVPEEGARMIALQTGDADMVLFPSPAQLPALRKDPKFTVHETTGIRVVFAGMHAGLPPLDDVRVRQALLHAVDRKAILDNIMEGSAGPALGVLAPGVFGYKDMQLDRLYPFDRAKAKALLAQAGFTPGPDGIMQKGGQRLSLSWLSQRGRYPKDGEITEAIQAMFKDVGVEAKVQFLEWGTVFPQLRGNPLNHHMFTVGWVTSNADADYSLYALFHSKQVPPTGWNTSRYANARVDALVEQARRSLNQTEREKLYGEVQDIIAKEMVWIPIYTTKEIIATRGTVKGFQIHPVEYNLALWKTWLDR